MTTFTAQVNDKDAELVFQILQKLKVKVIKKQEMSSLTKEIAAALKEVKEVQQGKRKPLTLDDL